MNKIATFLAIAGLTLYGCTSEEENFYGQYKSADGLGLVLMDENRCKVGEGFISFPCKWTLNGGEIKIDANFMGIQSVTTAQKISDNTLLYDNRKMVRIQNNDEEVQTWLAKVHKAEEEKKKYAHAAKDTVIKSFNASFPNNSLTSIVSNKSNADPTTFGKCVVGEINDLIKSKSFELKDKFGLEYVKQTLTSYSDSVLDVSTPEIQKIFKEDNQGGMYHKSLSNLYEMIDDILVNGSRKEFSTYNKCHTILPTKKTKIDGKQAFWGIPISGTVKRSKYENYDKTVYGVPVANWMLANMEQIGSDNTYKGSSIIELIMLSDSMASYDESNEATYYKFGTMYDFECSISNSVINQISTEFGSESAILFPNEYNKDETTHVWIGESLAVIANVNSKSEGSCRLTAYNYRKAIAYVSSIENAKSAEDVKDAKNAEKKQNKAITDM